jgi:hypothetical protein
VREGGVLVVTFDKIGETWDVVQTWPEPDRSRFYRLLTAPEERGWFQACATAVAARSSPSTPFRGWENCIDALDPDRSQIARAHLECARAACCAYDYKSEDLLRHAWEAVGLFEDARENFVYDRQTQQMDYDPVTQPRDPLDWPGLATALDKAWPPAHSHWTPTGNLDVKVQYLVDDAFTMLAREEAPKGKDDQPLQGWHQYVAEAWNLTRAMLGADRSVSKTVETQVLLVKEQPAPDEEAGKGLLVRLTLECIPDGIGAFYPAPALAFVTRPRIRRPRLGPRGGEVSNEFRDSEYHACTIVREQLKLWDRPCDVRWNLKARDPQVSLPLQLSGPSAGLAFALGLGQALLPEAR